jgi:aminopeptidase N
MIEGWIGEEKFRQALAGYFRKHRWGNAEADDLWAAFAQTGDLALVEALRRFIEQPGLPALSFTPMEGNRLKISQKRYRTITGSKASDQSCPSRKNKLTEVEVSKFVEACELEYELQARNRAEVIKLFQQLLSK